MRRLIRLAGPRGALRCTLGRVEELGPVGEVEDAVDLGLGAHVEQPHVALQCTTRCTMITAFYSLLPTLRTQHTDKISSV